MLRGVHLVKGMQCGMIKKWTTRHTPLYHMLRTNRLPLLFATAHCQSLGSLGLNLVTVMSIQCPWFVGRLNLGTLQTMHKASLISSLPVESESGYKELDWYSYCHMDMMVQVQSTPMLAWNASSPSVTMIPVNSL